MTLNLNLFLGLGSTGSGNQSLGVRMPGVVYQDSNFTPAYIGNMFFAGWFWFNTVSVVSKQFLFKCGSTTAPPGIEINLDTSSRLEIECVDSNGNTETHTTSALIAQKPYHLIFRATATERDLLLNGVAQSTAAISALDFPGDGDSAVSWGGGTNYNVFQHLLGRVRGFTAEAISSNLVDANGRAIQDIGSQGEDATNAPQAIYMTFEKANTTGLTNNGTMTFGGSSATAVNSDVKDWSYA